MAVPDSTEADRCRTSIVIATLDRADSLRTTLDALDHQHDPDFEVIVVRGPCCDHTDDVLAEFAERIVVLDNPVRNLSVSRNLGISAASGDIVAFLDDDAVPEPQWLAELLPAFDDPDVAVAGGIVFDHSGFAHQYTCAEADRLGNAAGRSTPFELGSYGPARWTFPYVQGTNCAFRRAAVVAIGGFDEAIDYFLDETDVCLRLIDAGHLVAQLLCAPVHHKFLRNDLRADDRVVRKWNTIVRSGTYFALRHAAPHIGIAATLIAISERDAQLLADVRADEDPAVIESFARAEAAGMDAAARPFKVALTAERMPTVTSSGRFSRRVPNPSALTIVICAQDIPPVASGIGQAAWNTAQVLTGLGHEVRLVTRVVEGHAPEVRFDRGVWVHAVASTDGAIDVDATRGLPAHIAARADSVAREIIRIAQHRPVHAIVGPLWDVEGLAAMRSVAIPQVTRAVTAMAEVVATRADWRSDTEFLRTIAHPCTTAEAELLAGSALVHAATRHAADTMTGRGVPATRLPTFPIAPVHVPAPGPTCRQHGSRRRTSVVVLGRLEPRKGTGALLDVVRTVLAAEPDIDFLIAGPDGLDEHGVGYATRLRAMADGDPRRVRVLGAVTDAERLQLLVEADVMLAPTRHESFGIVLSEALRAGVPVVSTVAGAVPEVVRDGVDGLLCAVDDAGALADAVLRLHRDPLLHARLSGTAAARAAAWCDSGAFARNLDAMLRSIVSERPLVGLPPRTTVTITSVTCTQRTLAFTRTHAVGGPARVELRAAGGATGSSPTHDFDVPCGGVHLERVPCAFDGVDTLAVTVLRGHGVRLDAWWGVTP